MKVIQMPPVHLADLVANSGNTVYGVASIVNEIIFDIKNLKLQLFVLFSSILITTRVLNIFRPLGI